MSVKNGRVTIREVYTLLKKMEKKIEDHYVSRKEFMPVKSIVYGMVGLLMAGVFTAMLAQVVRAAMGI